MHHVLRKTSNLAPSRPWDRLFLPFEDDRQPGKFVASTPPSTHALYPVHGHAGYSRASVVVLHTRFAVHGTRRSQSRNRCRCHEEHVEGHWLIDLALADLESRKSKIESYIARLGFASQPKVDVNPSSREFSFTGRAALASIPSSSAYSTHTE